MSIHLNPLTPSGACASRSYRPGKLGSFALWTLLALFASAPGSADGPRPAFDYEHLLNARFGDTSGTIQLGNYVAGFMPQGATTELLIYNAKKELVARNKFWDDSQQRDGIWAIVKPQPPLNISLTEPGIYQMLFMVNGEPATRFPFRLIQTSAGDDPFNPSKTYAFDGMWKRYAVVRLKDYDFKRTGVRPNFTIWTGQLDLDDGTKAGRFFAELLHEGRVVAHTPRGRGGFITNEHYRKEKFSLLAPHEKKDATHAPPYLLEDYADGAYNLRISRLPDGKVLREFEFSVTGGKMTQLPQTEIGYEPHIDYLMPRVDDDSEQIAMRMEEAVWLLDKP